MPTTAARPSTIFNNQTHQDRRSPRPRRGARPSTVYKDRTETRQDRQRDGHHRAGQPHVTVKHGNDKHEVSQGNRDVIVNGNDTHEIKKGNRDVKIDMGNDTLTIKMGNQTTKLDLGTSATEAMQSIELKVGQNSIKIDQTGVTIKGMMIKIQGQVQTEVKGLMMQVSGDAMPRSRAGSR